MAGKTVSVILEAKTQGFVAGVKTAQKSLTDLTAAGKTTQREAFDNLSGKAALAGGAIAVGLGVAVKKFAEFDSAMSGVAANSRASGAELDALRAAAIDLGADTKFSATEAADGINELAKAGVSTADILGGGLKGSLDLAAAGQIGVGEAAETAATAMTQFGLEGSEIPHVADLLTNAANKAQGGVGDLGAALKQSGLVAASTGLTIDETTASLAAFASAGLIGSDAGTSLKTMLQRLSAPVGAAAETMSELGISAYDASGEFVGMEALSGQLRTALEGLTPAQRNAALATMFGSDAVRAANVLYTEGAEGIAKWTDEVTVSGAASEQAAILTDNLQGDVERLGGAFDSAFIQTGSGANGALRTLVQGLTGVVDIVSDIPGPVLLVGGALTSIALGAPKAISAFRDLRANVDALTGGFKNAEGDITRTGKAVNGMAKWGGYAVGALAVATALGAIAESGYDAQPSIEDTTAAILDLNDAAKGDELAGFFDGLGDNAWIGNHVGDIDNLADAYNRLENPSLDQQFVDWKDNLFPGMSSGAERVEGSFDRMGQSLAGMPADKAAAQFDLMVEAIGGGEDASNRLLELMPAYRDSLTGAANDAKLAGDGATQMGGDLDAMGGDAAEAEKAIDALADSIKGLGDLLLNQRGSARDYQASLDDVAASIKENGKTLDINTEAGRANEAALDDLANSTQDWASAVFSSTQDVDKAQGVLDQGREKWLKYADALGMSEPKAKALADTLFTMPTDVAPEFSAPGADVTKAKADGVKDAVFGIPESKIAKISELGSSDARSRVLNLNDSIIGLDGKTVQVGEDGAQLAKGRVINLDASILGLKGKTVQVEEIGATSAGDRVVRLDGKIYALNGKTVTVQANVFGEGQVNSLQGAINRMSGRSINVNTYYNEYRSITDMGTYKARAMGGIDGVRPMARGGMLAGGSVRPDLYRTSARGILMAEDTKSKWESYIPERMDVRPRAEAILEETARRFGKQVIPMAQGGVLDHASRTYVAPQPRAVVQSASSSSAPSIDSGAIAAAVGAAMSGWQPMVDIGGSKFYGVMKRVTADSKGRG